MLDPILLQTFLAVAQTRSFTQAAERLGLRQSTVSQQVRKLEQQAGRRLGFTRSDEITIVFCGSKKSLVSGLPIAAILFAGHPLGLIVLPIMLFHQLQLMVCAAMARRYAASRVVRNNLGNALPANAA